MPYYAEIPPCDSCARLYATRQPMLLVEGGVQLRLCARCYAHAHQILTAIHRNGGEIVQADEEARAAEKARLSDDEVMLRTGRWQLRHGRPKSDEDVWAMQSYAEGEHDDIDLHLHDPRRALGKHVDDKLPPAGIIGA